MQASVSLGLDSGPFAAGIAQAESKAQSFSGRLKGLIGGGAGRSPWDEFTAPIPGATRKVEGLSGSIASLFRRTPERRAETALGQFVANLAGGNVAGAVSNLGLRISGFGLVAGIAVGAAIEVFQKFKGQVEATTESERKLNIELKTLGGVRGPEEVAKKFEAVSSAVEDLAKKSSTVGSKIGNLFSDVALSFATGRSGTLGSSSAATKNEIRAGLKAEKQLISDRADAEEKVVALRDEGLNVSERQGALDKVSNDAAIKRSAIDEETAKFREGLLHPPKGLEDKIPKALRDRLIEASKEAGERRKFAVTADERTSADAINKQFDLKSRQEEVQRRILDLQSSNLDKEHESLAVIREKIGLLERELAAGVTKERGGAIGTEIKRLGSEAAGTAREKVAAGAKDVTLTGSEFKKDALQDYQKRISESAVARAEAGQLAFETAGRSRTPEEQARFNEFQTEAGGASVQRGNLLDERRTLMRQQGLTLEQGGGQSLIGEDAYNYGIRAKRIGDIDKALGGKPSDAGSKPMTQAEFDAVMSKYWN